MENLAIAFGGLLALAAVCQAIVNPFKGLLEGLSGLVGRVTGWSAPNVYENVMIVVPALVGIVLTVATGQDLFTLIELELAPGWAWLGPLAAGIVVGRGSSGVHDFLSLLTALKNQARARS